MDQLEPGPVITRGEIQAHDAQLIEDVDKQEAEGGAVQALTPRTVGGGKGGEQQLHHLRPVTAVKHRESTPGPQEPMTLCQNAVLRGQSLYQPRTGAHREDLYEEAIDSGVQQRLVDPLQQKEGADKDQQETQ